MPGVQSELPNPKPETDPRQRDYGNWKDEKQQRQRHGCAPAALFPDGLQLADPFAVIRG
jgi:hypothetical protein